MAGNRNKAFVETVLGHEISTTGVRNSRSLLYFRGKLVGDFRVRKDADETARIRQYLVEIIEGDHPEALSRVSGIINAIARTPGHFAPKFKEDDESSPRVDLDDGGFEELEDYFQ